MTRKHFNYQGRRVQVGNKYYYDSRRFNWRKCPLCSLSSRYCKCFKPSRHYKRLAWAGHPKYHKAKYRNTYRNRGRKY